MSKNQLNNVLFLQKCILVNPDQKILALKRSTTQDKDRSGCWDLPGGTYELGEDVIDSIKREVKEETNLIISDPQLLYLASDFNHLNQFMSGENVFAVTHVCHTWTGEVTISDEHTEYRWVTPAELMTYDFGDDGGFFVASIKAFIALPAHI